VQTPIQQRPRFAGPSLKRVVGRAGSWGLTLLAVLGAGCIASVIASALFSISFVVFRTGSMEPAYPVGALAAVRDVPASSLKPGDVATVQRTAASVPVTHRVVSVKPDPASAGGAVLILKGDANSSEDPVEYRVQSARKMLVAVPAAGSVVMGLRSPTVLGTSSVLLAGLVGWVFWPRRQQVAPDAGRPAEDQAAPAGEVPCGTSTLP
jgi:signal peptidase